MISKRIYVNICSIIASTAGEVVNAAQKMGLSFLEKGVKMAAGKFVTSKDSFGNWVHTFEVPSAILVSSLDFQKITRTVSSIKNWLKKKPTTENVIEVISYEKKHENRTSAIGEYGCLTNYLDGE